MLKKLRIQGYRSLKDVTWEPGRLNVLIGPNASGKSNLMRALQLLLAAANGKLRESVIDQGGMVPLVWNGGSNFSFSLVDDLRNRLPEQGIAYFLSLRRLGESSDFIVDREGLYPGMTEVTNQPFEGKPYLVRHPNNYECFAGSENASEWMDLLAYPSESEAMISAGKIPRPAGSPLASIAWFRDQVRDWRSYHDWNTSKKAPIRQPALSLEESVLNGDGSNLIPFLQYWLTRDRDFETRLHEVLQNAFGEDFVRFRIGSELGRLRVFWDWKSSSFQNSQSDLSDGTLRFLLLVASLMSPSIGTLVAIDEPELGLHPKLLSLVASLAADASSDAQVLLTTHSPDLLDQLAPYEPDVFVSEWVDGETLLKKITGAELREWMRDYRAGDAFRSGELEALA